MFAAILESGDYTRLYTGLSLIVSATSDNRRVMALATFGALPLLLDAELESRAQVAHHVIEPEREAFARTLAQLRDAAAPVIWACAAAVQATGADWATVQDRLAGVMSIPQFMREIADSQLVIV